MKKHFSHVSLFSGAGGLDLGLDRAGFAMLVAVEKDHHARATLKANNEHFRFPHYTCFEDVNEVEARDILGEAGVGTGELDLLSGGPPCQPFSTAGNRRSIVDPRGSLFGRFLQVVGELLPRFFVIENVRGVLSAALRHRPLAQRGNGHDPLAPDEQLGSLLSRVILPEIKERLGYQITYGLVNAADYGVPQVRRRVFFVGSRDHELGDNEHTPSIGELLPPSHSETGAYGLPAWRTLGDVLDGLADTEQETLAYSQEKGRCIVSHPARRELALHTRQF